MLRILIVFIFLFSGCSPKVKIRMIEPSAVQDIGKNKKISVGDFTNDKVGLSNKIESYLANQKFDNQNYFLLVSRKDLDRVIKEQKFQNSGLLDLSDAVSVGNLIGAEAIISGSVTSATTNDTRFYEDRVRCADRKCKTYTTYSVACVNRDALLSADIRVINVERGEIIYANTLSNSGRWSHCYDDSRSLISPQAALQSLSDKMASDFVSTIAPQYRYFSVKLLDYADIKYSKNAKELLESSLEFIKASRYDKASALLIDLIDETNQQSFVAFYNLGVVKEAQARYDDAKKYYLMADQLCKEPVDEINEALIRIDELITKNKIVSEQMR